MTRAAGLAGFRSGQRTYHVRNRFSAHVNKGILCLVQDSFLHSSEKKVWSPDGMETEALVAYGKGAVKFEKYYSGSKDRECG